MESAEKQHSFEAAAQLKSTDAEKDDVKTSVFAPEMTDATGDMKKEGVKSTVSAPEMTDATGDMKKEGMKSSALAPELTDTPADEKKEAARSSDSAPEKTDTDVGPAAEKSNVVPERTDAADVKKEAKEAVKPSPLPSEKAKTPDVKKGAADLTPSRKPNCHSQAFSVMICYDVFCIPAIQFQMTLSWI